MWLTRISSHARLTAQWRQREPRLSHAWLGHTWLTTCEPKSHTAEGRCTIQPCMVGWRCVQSGHARLGILTESSSTGGAGHARLGMCGPFTLVTCARSGCAQLAGLHCFQGKGLVSVCLVSVVLYPLSTVIHSFRPCASRHRSAMCGRRSVLLLTSHARLTAHWRKRNFRLSHPCMAGPRASPAMHG
jgi:hypothetical protein